MTARPRSSTFLTFDYVLYETGQKAFSHDPHQGFCPWAPLRALPQTTVTGRHGPFANPGSVSERLYIMPPSTVSSSLTWLWITVTTVFGLKIEIVPFPHYFSYILSHCNGSDRMHGGEIPGTAWEQQRECDRTDDSVTCRLGNDGFAKTAKK